MNSVFYTGVDNGFLTKFRDHVMKERRLPSRGRMDATFVFITGDAGTGKTMIQNGLRYLEDVRPVFVGATNIAGREQHKVFSSNQMYVNDHLVYMTTFNHLFRLNPTSWVQCMKIVFGRQTDKNILSATMDSPAKFYETLWPALKDSCRYILCRYKKIKSKMPEFITPQEYAKYRKITAVKLSDLANDPRKLHDATMKHILAAMPRNRIYDYLVKDTIVFDEGGVIPCMWPVMNIAMYYYIHEMFNTGVVKPTIVIVGSCTQSTVINNTCIEGCEKNIKTCDHPVLPINDLSMIDMVANKCLVYQEGVIVRHNKFNRRMTCGDIKRAANIASMCNSLELGEPISDSVMDYIKNNMTVTKEEFFSKNFVRLCSKHKEVEECLKELDRRVSRDNIILSEECMMAAGDVGPDTLYKCTAPAGAMYRSANYVGEEWRKKIIKEPTTFATKMVFGIADRDKNLEEEEDSTSSVSATIDDEEAPIKAMKTTAVSNCGGQLTKFSQWTNRRVFYKRRPYRTSHTVRAQLMSITGSYNEILDDLIELDNLDLHEEYPLFTLELIKAISLSLQYTYTKDAQFIRDLVDQVGETTTTDELQHTLYDLRSILTRLVAERRASNKLKPGNDKDSELLRKDIAHIVSKHEVAVIRIPKNEVVFIEGRLNKFLRSPLAVRFRRTFVFSVRQCTLKCDQSVDDYSTMPQMDFQNRYCRKRPATSQTSMNSSVDIMSEDGLYAAPSCDFEEEEMECSDNSETDQLMALYAEAAADMEIASRETVPDNDHDIMNSSSNKEKGFTVLEMFPFKVDSVGTVAGKQGATIYNEVCGKVTSPISSYDLIVMSTRCISADHQWYYVDNSRDNRNNNSDGHLFTVTPLDQKTSSTIKHLIIKSSQTTGTI